MCIRDRLKITRNGKEFSFNANYGAGNAYSTISMTSGMDIRWTLGGADRIVFKSAGHIEPQTDSQINLGSNSVRFANVYADTLYGDGSNITGSTIRTNLTFDQSGGLDVTRTNANTAAMFRGNGGAGTIGLYDTTNSKLLFLSNSNGDFNVQTSTNSYAKKLTVKQAGKVGIGTDNPVGMFEVQKNGVPAIISNYNNSKHIQMDAGGSGAGFQLTTGHYFAINHQPYADRGTNNNLTERLRINSSGQLVMTNAATQTFSEFSTTNLSLIHI